MIVDHGFIDPDALPQWLIEPVPKLTIGVLEGDEAYQFFGVTDAIER